MASFFSGIVNFVTQLMSGGTVEIVLLIILIVVALILFLVLLWLLWKLLVLLGKGLLWLFKWGGETARTQSAARREAELAKPPPVATGWGSSPRIGLRMALAEARRLTGPDALRIVIIAGDGASDLCRSLGLTPPGVGDVGIAAGGDTLLVDASQANSRTLHKLARTLPWRRPTDGMAVLVDADGIPPDAVSRAATFARQTGMRVALHFVLPSSGQAAAWRIIDANNNDGDMICTQLASDTVRIWLSGGSREGLKELALAQSRDLPAALDRASSVAPSDVVDIASLGFSGTGLRGAVAQTVERTRPATRPGVLTVAALAALAVGAVLAVLAGVVAVDRTSRLRSAIDTASREAAVPWVADGIDAVPNAARVRRVAGLGARLAELTDFSMLVPLAPVVPNYSAPERLGAAFLDGYVLRPLAAALERQTRERLTPRDDPRSWVDDARVVGEWIAAWEGLADDPREVDIRALLSEAFGGGKNAWPEGIDTALIDTDVEPPLPAEGGLDVAALTDLARANFVLTMQRWADTVYTNGPVASAARRAGDRSASWRDQHQALFDLRAALQDPAQQWLTAAKDRPDHSFELRVLGRAVALSLIGQVTVLEAKAAISRIRIDARDMVEYFLLPDLGPLLVRASSGASLSMTSEASAWLGFLDKIANAGFAELPKDTAPRLVGLATIDVAAVAQARRRLQIFDQFASNLPVGLPPAIARKLIRELASELVIGVTIDTERALRSASDLGIAMERAERRAKAAPALDDLAEIESWLRQRQGQSEADRVLAVRGRIAEGVLAATNGVLVEEDPLGIHLDPTADANALVRRFERGVGRLIRIHEQLAEPFVEPAAHGRGWAAVEWRDMATDIAGYARGDVDSALTALEGVVRAYAEDPVAACDAPRPLSGRGDYLARTLLRFNEDLNRACGERALAKARAIFDELKAYYESQLAWLWPYSRDTRAPEVGASTLAEFLSRLQDTFEGFAGIEDPLALAFAENAEFWTRDQDGGAAVRFRLDWRSQPSGENLAENIAEISIDGAEQDESGIYTWRYGTPFAIRMRLAKNSAYRFLMGDGLQTDEWVITTGGNGALLRVFSGLTSGALSFEADVTNTGGAQDVLRVTARIGQADGRPMELPEFAGNSTPARWDSWDSTPPAGEWRN